MRCASAYAGDVSSTMVVMPGEVSDWMCFDECSSGARSYITRRHGQELSTAAAGCLNLGFRKKQALSSARAATVRGIHTRFRLGGRAH